MRKPKAKTAPQLNAAVPEQELPWITSTPVIEYTLEAFFDEDKERVELTLDEYEVLKRTVAKMRGYEVPKNFEPRHS